MADDRSAGGFLIVPLLMDEMVEADRLEPLAISCMVQPFAWADLIAERVLLPVFLPAVPFIGFFLAAMIFLQFVRFNNIIFRELVEYHTDIEQIYQ